MPQNPDRSISWPDPDDSSFQRGHNHLLLIGIDQYQHVGKLNNAVRDAKAFGQLMQAKYQFDATRITTLFDQDATRANLATSFRKIIQQVQPGDNLVVYYSGHGHYDEILEEGYWVPVEARFQAEVEYISYSYLKKNIKAIKSQHTLFIVDSCYSGAVFVRDRDLKTERFERDPSRWLLASGRNEVVPDGVAGGNSPFAEQLLDLLDRYSTEGMRVGTLVDKLTTSVTYNSRQTPIGRPLFEVGDKGGEFFFHPKRNLATDYAAAQQAGTAEALTRFLSIYPDFPQRVELENQIARLKDQEAWQQANQRHSIHAYRTYRQSHPQGKYRQEALDQIEQLEASRDWTKAQAQDTISAYERHLDRHPRSPHRTEAQAAIDLLIYGEQAQAWKTAQKRHTLAAYRTYLSAYPQGPHQQQAQAAIKEIEQIAADKQHQEAEAKQRAEAEKRKREAEAEAKKRRNTEQAQPKEAAHKRQQAAPSPQQEDKKGNIRRYILIGVPVLLLLMFGIYQITTRPQSTDPGLADSYDTSKDSIRADSLNQAEVSIPIQPKPDQISPEEIAIPPQDYTITSSYHQDVAIYRTTDGRMGLINREGQQLGRTYDKVEGLAHGFAVFHQDGQRGYLNLKGEEVIAAQFAAAWPFQANRRAKVKQNGRIFYIDTQGECIANCLSVIEEVTTSTKTPSSSSDLPIPLPRMIRIPGGSFQIGSENGESDEQPIYPVTLSTFYLAETEVTFEQYDYFCEQTGREKPDDEGWGRGRRPVINVSWTDAQAYITWLNQQPGQSGYRLPTEAEWEYAAGGGATGRTTYAGTSSESGLDNYAVFYDNSGSRTQAVKSKRANSLGLYDMSGNVWEWCQDRYGSNYYASSPTSNPQGPSSGSRRVLRGGCWYDYAYYCRVAGRDYSNPFYRYYSSGFRLARTP